MSIGIDTAVLGETRDPIALSSRADNRAAALALACQARQRLWLYTPDLEPALYDQGEFLDAIRRLALAHARAEVRVLVQDPAAVEKTGHRLVELARRLSSFIAVRQPAPPYLEHAETFLLADDAGVLHRTLSSRPEGSLCFADPPRVRRLAAWFQEAWEHAATPVGLRRLHL